ncbi:MAG: phosphotransferase [Bacillota bacterium]|nr:phosphotransferase [Bacillota bacterium]
MAKLMEEIQNKYHCKFDNIELIRDMIGQVYLVEGNGERYVFKMFRKSYSEQAIQSAGIINYLHRKGYPVPRIINTLDEEPYYVSETEQRVGVLYEYIMGTEPDTDTDVESLGRLAGEMRSIMEGYSGNIVHHGKEFFIDRYIDILDRMGCEEKGKFSEYGNELWNRVRNLPEAFCHGDLHTGNMLIDSKHKITIFDFDASGKASAAYDAATLCDKTDYFNLSDANFYDGYRKTRIMLERFLKGYSRYYSMSDEEIRAVFNFIAIRHFDIQATIMESQGLNCVDQDFIKKQLQWLMKWDKVCTNN